MCDQRRAIAVDAFRLWLEKEACVWNGQASLHPILPLIWLIFATNENTKRWLSSHRPAEMEMSVRRQIYITLDEAMLAVKLHTSALQRSLLQTSNT
jgi:hypothetical protein